MLHRAYARDAIVEVRNFYGTLRVKQTTTAQADPERMLLNGAIQHGTQIFAPNLSRLPTTYYATDSGIGVALRFCCDARKRNIGVIGLGAGTLAAYGQYIALDGEMRALERAGEHQAAMALKVGVNPGQLNWAFAQFDQTLDDAIVVVRVRDAHPSVLEHLHRAGQVVLPRLVENHDQFCDVAVHEQPASMHKLQRIAKGDRTGNA